MSPRRACKYVGLGFGAEQEMAPAEAVRFPTAMSSTNLLILRLELAWSVVLIRVGNDEEELPSGVIILQIMQ